MKCLSKFQRFKEAFEEFENTVIKPLKQTVKIFKEKNCYGKLDERINLEKGLMTLEISVTGIIFTIKVTVQNLLTKQLNSIDNVLKTKKERLNSLKSAFEGGQTKEELSEVINTLLDIESELTKNRDSFKEIYNLITELEKYLMQEHRDEFIKFAGKLPYKFDGLFKQTRLYLTKAQRQHTWKSLESDISDFGTKLEVKDRHLKIMINRTKKASETLCIDSERRKLTTEFDDLLLKFEAYQQDFDNLNTTLHNDFKTHLSFQKHKKELTKMIEANEKHMQTTKKYSFFLFMYRKIHCQSEEDNEEAT